MTEPVWIEADWPSPAGVQALTTTRLGGFSQAPFDALNLGARSGDDPLMVERNRTLLMSALHLNQPITWLEQVHGKDVIRLESAAAGHCADASVTSQPGQVCAVLTADCLPVFFAAIDGSEVGVAHAGWRGLAAGVLESTVAAMRAKPGELVASLGPAIGPQAFEVGPEVRAAFIAVHADNQAAFKPSRDDRQLCDIFKLARMHLERCGVGRVYGGGLCTWSDRDRFYSYRRDGATGRMASLIWRSRA
ncbi:MAG: peptidoglycan editing factor PgeF [Thiotrichales bacterium]